MNREARQQVDFAQSHTNYQMSMASEDLEGNISLDIHVNITHPSTRETIGSLSLRIFLLNYLKMQDSHPMITEVHQDGLCQPVHMVIPQSEQVERMIGMMHKNLPTFLFNLLSEAGFTKQ